MNQAADAFVESDHDGAPFQTNALRRRMKGALELIHVRLLDKGEEKFTIFALLLDINIQQKH